MLHAGPAAQPLPRTMHKDNLRLEELLNLLVSPSSRRALCCSTDRSHLETDPPKERFPIIDGVPVLLPADELDRWLARHSNSAPSPTTLKRVALAIARRGPSISNNLTAEKNFRRLVGLLLSRGEDQRPRVLVIGGATAGEGIYPLLAEHRLETIETDIALGPRTKLVCDAHHLPFPDSSFDAVVAQAVLEHVVDPPNVVEEIYRVLRPHGYVYSEIPFMQQVHEGAHDLTRYTLIGHRRLFRLFDEVESGMSNGPGMALAWSIRYFLYSLVRGRTSRGIVARATSLALFWLKYVDHFLQHRDAALDAASGTFFFGIRRATPVEDVALLAQYRGGVSDPGLTRRG